MPRPRRKAKKVSALIRWTGTLVVMGVYFALGIIYIIPGPTLHRLAMLTGVEQASVTVGFGVRSIARMIIGHLTRQVFRTQMLCLGYGCVAIILSISTAAMPYTKYIYVMLAQFACHGMSFGYVKNTSRMVLRQLWAHRLPKFIKARNYIFLVGAMVGPFLTYPPIQDKPSLPPVVFLMCNFTEQINANGSLSIYDISCRRDDTCGPLPGIQNQTTPTTSVETSSLNFDKLAFAVPNIPHTTVSPLSTTASPQTALLPGSKRTVVHRCSKVLSPEKSFFESLTSFEIQYLFAGAIALLMGAVASIVLYHYQKALLKRKRGAGGADSIEESTGTKLDILPVILRQPAQNALERIGLMKYVPKNTPPPAEGTGGASKLSFLPAPVRGPVERLLKRLGMMSIGEELEATASNLAGGVIGKVNEAGDRVKKGLEDKEQSILRGEERAKAGTSEDAKGSAMGTVASSIAGIVTDTVKGGPKETSEKNEPDEAKDQAKESAGTAEPQMSINSPTSLNDDAIQTLSPPVVDGEAGKEEESDDDDDDDLIDSVEDVFQFFLAIFMSVVMGLSAVITYTNFIAKYLMTLGAKGLECSAITSMFNVAVIFGSTVVVSLYKKFKIYRILFTFNVLATTTLVFLCIYGHHYYVVWALSAVFGFFAGKIQEGVEDLADDYDILSDEFEGIMDKGESLVLSVLPVCMGYLMAWEPKTLFYVTVMAFGVCMLFLVYLPITAKSLEDNKSKREMGSNIEENNKPPIQCDHTNSAAYEHMKGQTLLLAEVQPF